MLALLTGMAIALHLFESWCIPPFFGVFRIGLANVIALIALYHMGIKEMLTVNVLRVIVGNLLSGTFLGSSFWISAGGVFLSCAALVILKKVNASAVFTSVISAIAHSVGQVLIVAFFYKQSMIFTILPYFFFFSIPAGLFTGWIAGMAVKRISPLKK